MSNAKSENNTGMKIVNIVVVGAMIATLIGTSIVMLG